MEPASVQMDAEATGSPTGPARMNAIPTPHSVGVGMEMVWAWYGLGTERTRTGWRGISGRYGKSQGKMI